jgi:Trk K+ transport system NAD-binding subunit
VILCINKIKQISDSVRVITNIHNKNFIPIAMKAGADKVIPSSAIGGKLISFALNSPEIVRWVMDATTMTSKELELVEVQVRKTAFSGKTIGDIDRLIETYANIISVRTIDGLKQIPDDKYLLKDEDSLVMIVNVSKLPKGKDLSDRIGSLVKKK